MPLSRKTYSALLRRTALTLAAVLITSFPAYGHAKPKEMNVSDYGVTDDNASKLSQYISEHPEAFSGFWFDHASNQFVIAIPDAVSLPATLEGLKSKLSLKPASGSTAKLSVERRQHSLATLSKKVDEVTAQQSSLQPADRLQGRWYVDQRKNKVVVQTNTKDNLSSASWYTEKSSLLQVEHSSSVIKPAHASAKLNAQTKFVKVDKSKSDISSQAFPDRLLDGLPFYTANRIIRLGPDSRATWCTSAVVNPSSTHMYTAGHCFPGGATLHQGYFDEADNTVYYTYDIGPVVSVEWGNNRIDAESVQTGRYGNRQYHGGVTDPTDFQHFIKFDGWIGMYVCANGSVSGTQCTGEIVETNVCANYPDFVVCGLTVAKSRHGNQLVQPGDSGGPVIRDFTGAGAQVVGIISGMDNQNNVFTYTPMRPACAQLIPYSCN